MQMQMSLKKKEDTGETRPEKVETIACTSSDKPVQVDGMCCNNDQEKNEILNKKDDVARPSLKYAYKRRGKDQIFNWISRVHKRIQLDNGRRHELQASKLFSQPTPRHKVRLEGQQRDIQISPATNTRGVEIKDWEPNTRWQPHCTSTDDSTGTSNNHQQNVVMVNQPVPVETDLHNNNQEGNDMLNKEDEDTSFRVDYKRFYERRKTKMQTSSEVHKQSKLDKGKRQVQASSIFSQVTSRLKAHSEAQRRDFKISPATITRETVSSKLSSKKGRGRKAKALTGRSSRSVPRQRKRKSDIQGIEDGDLNYRRQTYFLGKNEKTPSICDLSPKEFDLVDMHVGYQESLLNFAKNLGPTAQSIAFKKLKLLNLAQTTAHAFQAPVPHQPSSAWGLSEDPKENSVIMDRGCGRKSVSAEDMRPPFDRGGTFSAGSANIASLPVASRIQRSTNVVHRSVAENVHFPTHNHNQLVLQQNHLPPSNANAVRPGYQIPTLYEARQTQIASKTVRPSRLSAMCRASDSGYGVGSGHQYTPLNELQRHMQLQNQLGLGDHQQQKMGLEQQPLPIFSSVFDTGTSSSVRNHQTTSNAGWSAQQLPLAHRSYTNLELQLRTKPLSPDEAN